MTLDTVSNFRELGGLPTTDGGTVRTGRLFRSGHLGEASDADVTHLARLDLGLVVDFRTDHDIEVDGPDRIPPGVRHVRAPIGDDAGRTSSIRELFNDPSRAAEVLGDGQAVAMILASYRRNATAEWCNDSYRTFFAELVAQDGAPVLWHCSAGKDRAGWASCLVGFALGVERDAIIENYLDSNRHRRIHAQGDRLIENGLDPEMVLPFIEVRREYVEASIAGAEEHWGDLATYLRDGLGLTDTARARLREHYVVQL